MKTALLSKGISDTDAVASSILDENYKGVRVMVPSALINAVKKKGYLLTGMGGSTTVP